METLLLALLLIACLGPWALLLLDDKPYAFICAYHPEVLDKER